MPPLSTDLRKQLDNAVVRARDAAEAAARAALTTLAVDKSDAFATLTPEQRRLRVLLRARWRQLGGESQEQGLALLIQEVAYEQWHRMLFARFLAENGLLMHPDGVAVTLQDCADLAADEGEPDGWMLAARYAWAMLPGMFRIDDPSAQVRFTPEGRQMLEAILASLPTAVFTADDALGWVYQFWQSKKKKEVNESGRKIGGADLAPVTQLFTEHYMVRFLLENSLGTWWAARRPDSPLVKDYAYLRFKDDGTPAAGTFPGWPERAAEVTVMDPCCGSGHFLVAAFEMLRRMRMEEEGLSERAAADAVLRDNLFGLEIDARCTQIAVFALAVAAWKVGGYRPLPIPHVACSGIPVQGQLETWKKLAGDDSRLRNALERLYEQFCKAPDLGSLINPADVPGQPNMFDAEPAEVERLLAKALADERGGDDPAAAIFGDAAVGVARAAELLARRCTLVATNVPYLQRAKQSDTLRNYVQSAFPDSKEDLAVSFLSRCAHLTDDGGSYALVTPQLWLFLGRYKALRQDVLTGQTVNCIVLLGSGAFDTIGGAVVNVILGIYTNEPPATDHPIIGISTLDTPDGKAKRSALLSTPLILTQQKKMLSNPDGRIALDGQLSELPLLSRYASALGGITTGDSPRYRRCFWELAGTAYGWVLQQTPPEETIPYGGREHILPWENGGGALGLAARVGGATIAGRGAWGRRGIAIQITGALPATLYTGQMYENICSVILPRDSDNLATIWAFCQSPEFYQAVRRIDNKLGVTCNTLAKVPFDLARWQKVAYDAGPLPEPYSNDPTQWLFKGSPADTTEPLQVAVARLLGYHWPQQAEDGLDAYADADGIVCIPALVGEAPAAERLRVLLAAAFGAEWSAGRQEQLLADRKFGGKGLEAWLRDDFFAQHCKLFHNRPFIWHITDGRKDGFSALVNYHTLDGARLATLIYTYLGAWIAAQKADAAAGVVGAEGRLVAAQELQRKLQAIATGEPPYDIYVRWKPLERQPIGWDPDLNDGVRLNVRPFVLAGVLRSKFTVHWNKDRGTNPDRTERINDRHLAIKEKQAARKAAGA